ncbi:hypothetical protein [Desulfosediminicola sp.]|uniref:hypothetical protein n=1 Tax=Desulfosediminicola sp. TaxID=2886825 RepID=UPI003AF2DDC7
MTPEQRYDLAIEWRRTSHKVRHMIRLEYRRRFGNDNSEEHWEEYLTEALNIKPFWKTAGLI